MNLKETNFYKILREKIYLILIYPKEIKAQKNRANSILGEFEHLRQFKGIHKNERCFIVATGPSLKEEDFCKLENENTIGVNGLCLWFNEKRKETSYFVVSDEEVYERIESNLKSLKTSKIFISERVGLSVSVDKKFYKFPVSLWNRFIRDIKKKKLSNDISICSYDEETVVIHAIQLALYLGFSEIYLLGADCNYKQTKQYSVDHGKSTDVNVGDKMILSYLIVKNHQKKLNFKIYNATRGGKLEVFERINLENVLKNQKNT